MSESMFATLASKVVLSITTVGLCQLTGSSDYRLLRALNSLGCRLVVVVLALLRVSMI